MKPAKDRRIPPRLHNALKLLPKKKRLLINSDNRTKQVFESLIRQSTEGKAVIKQNFKKIVFEAASQALVEPPKENRVLKKIALLRPGLAIRAFLFFRRKNSSQLLFRSGARMHSDWYTISRPRHSTAAIMWDAPVKVNEHPENCFRVVMRPSSSERQQPDFDKVQKKLARMNHDRDMFPELKGGIGYFSLSVHQPHPTEKQLGSIAVIWTMQMRGLPDLPQEHQRRYQNWAMEQFQHIENTLKRAGIRRLAVRSDVPEPAHDSGKRYPVEVYHKVWSRIQKQGYSSETVRLPEVGNYKVFVRQL